MSATFMVNCYAHLKKQRFFAIREITRDGMQVTKFNMGHVKLRLKRGAIGGFRMAELKCGRTWVTQFKKRSCDLDHASSVDCLLSLG